MAVLESMAAGKAVVGNRIGGIPELVIDGQNGLLVEPGNAQQLASAIGQLAADRQTAKEMGKRAREMAEQRFSPERHYQALCEVYSACL